MKVCFIWVEDFRNFKNFGFNLSSSLKFKYDDLSHSISARSTEELPEDFFGPRITDVIGLIGKNGAGKSNAVELICKILKGGKTSLQADFLIILEDDGQLVCHYSFFGGDRPFADFKVDFREYSGNINPLKVVFFSNVFDERQNGFDREVSDISVNNLYRKRNTFIKKKEVTDFEKQIKLIGSKIFPTLNIDLPTHFQITSRVWVNKFSMASDPFSNYRDSSQKINDFKAMFRSRLREIKPEAKFVHILRFGFFFEKIHNYLRESRNRRDTLSDHFVYDLVGFIDNLSNRRTEDITEGLIDYIDQQFYDYTKQPDLIYDSEDREKFREQISFLKDLKHQDLNLNYNSEGARNRNLEYFTFDYSSRKSYGFINKFIYLFEELSLFEVNWLGISSGHKAYLNLFASLYQELRYTKQENLLLCIDEGDLYLHPKWQVEFFDKLTATLPVIFSGRIQLVMTSHSPFLLSDLPKQNITILDKEFPNSSFDGVELKKNTFGGNLYDLYAEPFFLGSKRTSDFAFNKISGIIDEAETKKLTPRDKRRIKAILNLIGDEVIQFRINKLLNND